MEFLIGAGVVIVIAGIVIYNRKSKAKSDGTGQSRDRGGDSHRH